MASDIGSLAVGEQISLAALWDMSPDSSQLLLTLQVLQFMSRLPTQPRRRLLYGTADMLCSWLLCPVHGSKH